MKSAPPINTPTLSQRGTGLLLVSLCVLAGQTLAACGSTDAGFSASGANVAGSPAQTSSAAGAAVAGASSASTAGTDDEPAEAGSGNGGTNSAGGSTETSTAGSAVGGAPSASGGSATQAGASGSGDVCSSTDACTSCLCNKCATQFKTCEATPGCEAIANCVATSKCSGVACYCGTADTLACAAGTANGPCRDVILSAPGGHKPTLTNQSAGPATDAATAVGTCGTKNDACTASCE